MLCERREAEKRDSVMWEERKPRAPGRCPHWFRPGNQWADSLPSEPRNETNYQHWSSQRSPVQSPLYSRSLRQLPSDFLAELYFRNRRSFFILLHQIQTLLFPVLVLSISAISVLTNIDQMSCWWWYEAGQVGATWHSSAGNITMATSHDYAHHGDMSWWLSWWWSVLITTPAIITSAVSSPAVSSSPDEKTRDWGRSVSSYRAAAFVVILWSFLVLVTRRPSGGARLLSPVFSLHTSTPGRTLRSVSPLSIPFQSPQTLHPAKEYFEKQLHCEENPSLLSETGKVMKGGNS